MEKILEWLLNKLLEESWKKNHKAIFNVNPGGAFSKLFNEFFGEFIYFFNVSWFLIGGLQKILPDFYHDSSIYK